jgi:hypothetical protein
MDEHEQEKRVDLNSELGMSRRDLLRRSAIVGGTLLWVAPAIQSLSPKAFAASPGGAGCAACYCFRLRPNGSIPTGDNEFDRAQHGPIGPGGLASEEDCAAFCATVTTPQGRHYTGSRYCSGDSGCTGVARDQDDGTLPATIPSCTGTVTRNAGPDPNYGVICCQS